MVLLTTLLTGCSVSGGYIPVAPMEMKKEMVTEYNAPTKVYVEAVTGRGSINRSLTYKGKDVPVVFNLDEMSMFVANSISAELTKKGANVNKTAEKTIRVKVLDVNIVYSANYRVDGALEFQLSEGYTGTCNFGSSGVKAYRALGGALQWGVANTLNHTAVRAFLMDEDLPPPSKSPLPEERVEEPEKPIETPEKQTETPAKQDDLKKWIP